MIKGKWIAIDGMNGSGKTAVMTMLMKKYGGLDKFKFTREPGGTDVGEHIRKLLVEKTVPVSTPIDQITKELLFMADRRHNYTVNYKLLDLGINVICDRSDMSFLVYGVIQESVIWYKLAEWGEMFHGYSPDIYIFLKVRAEVALERIMKRDKDVVKNKDIEYSPSEALRMAVTYQSVSRFLTNEKRKNVYEVDANRSIEDVFEFVAKVIEDETSFQNRS